MLFAICILLMVASKRSDACCRDPCQAPSGGRSCRKSSAFCGVDQQDDDRHCRQCTGFTSCDGYTVAAAGVVAAGLTVAAMYCSR
jgi:hypothetical protein